VFKFSEGNPNARYLIRNGYLALERTDAPPLLIFVIIFIILFAIGTIIPIMYILSIVHDFRKQISANKKVAETIEFRELSDISYNLLSYDELRSNQTEISLKPS
jgi:flagellar basal body-associated protein FliL